MSGSLNDSSLPVLRFRGRAAKRVTKRRLSRLGELCANLLLGQLNLPPEAEEKLKKLHSEGTCVYVGQNQSRLLMLHQLYNLERLNLPLPKAVIGPLHLAWLSQEQLAENIEELSAAAEMRHFLHWGFLPTLSMTLAYQKLKTGNPVSLCLNSAYQGLLAPWPFFEEFIPLIKAQEESSRPLLIVPYMLFTSMDPPKQKGGLLKRLLGNSFFDTIYDFINLLLPEGNQLARVRLGNELNLKEWLKNAPKDLPPEELCGRLYEELRARFLNEERVAIGPRRPKAKDAFHFIMQDPKVLAAAELNETASPKERHQYEQRVQKTVREIAANYNGRFLRLLSYAIGFIVSKIYDDVVIDRPALKEVARAMEKGPIIICPSHKSHIDYLVASSTLFHAGLTPPHIAAGANLSFWPLGPIFRRGGAFFIRRTFRGDAFYTAVMKSYVRYLLSSGYSIEFFMEGGRSRTGKLLMPKMGMMAMVLEAWRDEGYPDIHVVPLSIDYERIVESGSYTKELAGGEKRPEDIKGLLSSSRLLSLKGGRIYLNFASPISLRKYLADQKGMDLLAEDAEAHKVPAETLSKDDWRELNQHLCYRALYNVGMAVTLTPTALLSLVLLSQPGRVFTREQLVHRVDFFSKILYATGIAFSPMLKDEQNAAIEAVIDSLLSEGLLERESHHRTAKKSLLKLSEMASFELDFYKNNVMQQLAPLAIAAGAVITAFSADNADVSYEKAAERADFLSRLFKNEFLFAPEPDDLPNFDIAMAFLAAHGFIDITADNTVRIVRKEPLKWLLSTLDSFIEAYWVVISSLAELRRFPMWQGEFSKKCLAECRFRFSTGKLLTNESASKILIGNAIGWLLENGYLLREAISGEGVNKNRLPLQLNGDEAIEASLAEKLKPFLPLNR